MNKLLFILFFFSLALNAQAQIDTTQSFRHQLFSKGYVAFGIKAGYSIADIHGKDIDFIFANKQTKNLSAFHAGIFLDANIGRFFSLKHELIINQRGAGVVLNDSLSGNYDSKLAMLYLDLFPISPTFHYKNFQLYAGPYVSVLMNAYLQRKNTENRIYKDKSIFGEGGNDESEQKYLQKFDFGLNVGAEYQFPSGLLVGWRYNYGLTDIFQYANSFTFDDSKTNSIKIFNQSFWFSIGYKLTGKGKYAQ